MTAASNSEARKRQAELADHSMTGVELSEFECLLAAKLSKAGLSEFVAQQWIREVIAARLAPAEAERDEWRAECLRWRDEAEAGSFDALSRRANAAEVRAARAEALVEAVRESVSHPHMGPDDTDASMLRAAAKRLRGGFEPGGSHTKQTVANVITAVADLIDGGAS